MSQFDRKVPGPYEILDLDDGQSLTIRVMSHERGTMTIQLRRNGASGSKEIPVLRVHVDKASKEYPPMYYDITSKTLQAQLIPHLQQPLFERNRFVITKHGVAPRARFTLEVLPD